MRHPIQLLLALALATACTGGSVATSRPAPAPAPASRTVAILHINDVYEITPGEGGAAGGLARVAGLRATLRERFPGLVTTLGGDYHSPSAMGLAVVDGQRLAGRQMVDVLNQVGVDLAVLGNHEFDIREDEFRARLAEARFRILTSTVTDSAGRLFPGTLPRIVRTVPTASGPVRLGFFGVTLDDNRPAWVRFEDPIAAARREVALLRDSADVIIALTHQTLAEDQLLLEDVPGIAALFGGHEHENYLLRRGRSFTPIIKADANARTVALATIALDSAAPRVDVTLLPIGRATPTDAATETRVQQWVARADSAFTRDGLEPRAVVTTLPEPLDGREATVRVREGNLSALIAEALRREVPDAEVGLMNGGLIRIDDVVPAGPVLQYDVIRVLPFGGKIVRTTMTGALLERVLEQGIANRGSGGFLHADGARKVGDRWLVAGEPIDPVRRYVVATNDFLLTGREKGLDYLAPTNAALGPITPFRDIRLVVIREMQRRYGAR
ncbi:MAG: bifunctional metallophosphatase/5'-nucleotidase [Phycisphaerales bacterium]